MKFVLYEIWLLDSTDNLVLLEYLVELDAIKSFEFWASTSILFSSDLIFVLFCSWIILLLIFSLLYWDLFFSEIYEIDRINYSIEIKKGILALIYVYPAYLSTGILISSQKNIDFNNNEKINEEIKIIQKKNFDLLIDKE